ncbi:MAG: acyl carrier protein [Acidimicrobiia bacterium]|nr:acyl carrier protein [Acidimicrobiia bacterium]
MEHAIVRFVNEELLGGNGPRVTADDEIVLDGTVDSLGVTRLVDFIETEFKLAVPAQDVTIDNFRTITTMAAYVRTRQESAATT